MGCFRVSGIGLATVSKGGKSEQGLRTSVLGMEGLDELGVYFKGSGSKILHLNEWSIVVKRRPEVWMTPISDKRMSTRGRSDAVNSGA